MDVEGGQLITLVVCLGSCRAAILSAFLHPYHQSELSSIAWLICPLPQWARGGASSPAFMPSGSALSPLDHHDQFYCVIQMRCRAVVIVSKLNQSPAFPSGMLFSFCCGKVMWGRKGLFYFSSYSPSVWAREGTLGQNLEAEAVEGAGLLQVHIQWPRPAFLEMLN